VPIRSYRASGDISSTRWSDPGDDATVSRLILRILDSDAQVIHEIQAAEPIMPPIDRTITFEIAPGEVVTRYVSAFGAIRYDADAVIVEIDTSPLDDDEDP
jgi:hypothetical protein